MQQGNNVNILIFLSNIIYKQVKFLSVWVTRFAFFFSSIDS